MNETFWKKIATVWCHNIPLEEKELHKQLKKFVDRMPIKDMDPSLKEDSYSEFVERYMNGSE